MAEIYKRDITNKKEIFPRREQAEQYLEEENGITISHEVEAYIVNKSSNPEDIYHAAAIYCEQSKTFRAPIENYFIASFKEDGTLDFSAADVMVRDKVMAIPEMKELQNHAKWNFDRKDKRDDVWTAWLLSEYMKKTGMFKTIKYTSKRFRLFAV